MHIRPRMVPALLREALPQSLSLRQRLAAYLIALTCAVAFMLFFVLNLIGIVDPIDSQLGDRLSRQLDMTATSLLHDTDEAAACGLVLADRIADTVSAVLRERGLDFDGLRNNEQALSEIQSRAYAEVSLHMQLATCSGAFYLLDSTVNDALPRAYYNGLYLKYANLYAENTLNNRPCMFRGSYAVARQSGIGLYSTWQLETEAGTFPQAAALLRGEDIGARRYLLTEVYKLPDSWERVRLLCVPIRLGGRTIGVCGFEISDIYFRLSYPAGGDGALKPVCALLTRSDGRWTGQTTCTDPVQAEFTVGPYGRFVEISDDMNSYVGLMREIDVGSSAHSIAVMMPRAQYDATVRTRQVRAAALLLILTLISISACIFLSHRYVNPILRGLSQLKADQAQRQPSNIPEIDDLFEYLAARDRSREAELNRLQAENADVQRERERAESALTNLHAAGIQEIDPAAYGQFRENLHTLTPREREIFDLYLEGRTGKEIQELLGINQNTIKYHNKNIYDKLGVHSRKELIRYAAFIQREAGSNAE